MQSLSVCFCKEFEDARQSLAKHPAYWFVGEAYAKDYEPTFWGGAAEPRDVTRQAYDLFRDSASLSQMPGRTLLRTLAKRYQVRRAWKTEHTLQDLPPNMILFMCRQRLCNRIRHHLKQLDCEAVEPMGVDVQGTAAFPSPLSTE